MIYAMWIAAAALILLQVYDAWSTYVILERGGRETNKRMAFIMDRIGVVPTLILSKGAISAAVLALSVYVHLYEPGYATFFFGLYAVATAFYVWTFWRFNFKYDDIGRS